LYRLRRDGKSGTSSLIAHLKRVHNICSPNTSESVASNETQSLILDYVTNVRHKIPASFSNDAFRFVLTRWIVEGNLPFLIVEKVNTLIVCESMLYVIHSNALYKANFPINGQASQSSR
jgi:hypothetical protein